MAHITVIGGGAWGKALYHALAQNHEVSIVSRQNLGADFQQKSLQDALELSPYCVVAICSSSLREFFSKHTFRQDSKLLMAVKGICEHSGAFVSEIMEGYFPSHSLAYLGGPSFAAEVAKNLPCALEIHSTNPSLSQEFQAFFPAFMKIYTGDDVIGAEIAGAYKNVIAIASGICAGLELGQNAKAALMARGLVEMTRFGEAFGAKPQTFLSLCGAGDLFLSANSTLSRNYRVGLALALGKDIASIIKELGEVAEGVKTAQAIVMLSEKHRIYTPLASEVCHIIQGKDAMSSVQEMLARGR